MKIWVVARWSTNDAETFYTGGYHSVGNLRTSQSNTSATGFTTRAMAENIQTQLGNDWFVREISEGKEFTRCHRSSKI